MTVHWEMLCWCVWLPVGLSSSESQLAVSQHVSYISQGNETSLSSSASPTLVTQLCQSGTRINPVWSAHMHQSGNSTNGQRVASANPPVLLVVDDITIQVLNIDSGREGIFPSFDLDSLQSEDKYTFSAQSTIMDYLEKHFHRTLDKPSRTAMHKTHPILRTAVTNPPLINKFI